MPRKPTHADADLLLRLYEIRRDPELRKARAWFLTKFRAKSWEEIGAKYLSHTDEDRWFRMTISYWEMVGTMVNRGVLHDELFFDHTGEDVVTWERCKPWIAGARAAMRDHLNEAEDTVRLALGLPARRVAPDAFGGQHGAPHVAEEVGARRLAARARLADGALDAARPQRGGREQRERGDAREAGAPGGASFVHGVLVSFVGPLRESRRVIRRIPCVSRRRCAVKGGHGPAKRLFHGLSGAVWVPVGAALCRGPRRSSSMTSAWRMSRVSA